MTSHNVRGGKSFGSPGMLQYLGIEQYDPHNAQHTQLAAASRQAHQRAGAGQAYTEIQAEIDRIVADLWGISGDELELNSRRDGFCGP